ncbi:hypothetical protein XU18_4856 [Perkinsela sp. CCAP 1560/4]|nr:hypothetical protein XU18_4856 [Perkinsela sp. CCAP 1560/4]|eukprot:KNH03780.1 hypothetical protein XU18_4856 [Perkinsela sp. CCAP 1560/4]
MTECTLLHVRSKISEAYEGALKDAIRNSTKECFLNALQNVSDIHTQCTIANSQTEEVSLFDSYCQVPIFHAAAQVIENPNLIPSETIRHCFACVSKDFCCVEKGRMKFIRPINGISVRALDFLKRCERKVDSLFKKIKTYRFETPNESTFDNFTARSEFKSPKESKASSEYEFDWHDSLYTDELHRTRGDELLFAFLDYNANVAQIKTVFAYLRRVHAIYWRYKLLYSTYQKEVKLSHVYHLPRLPQVIVVLIRTAFPASCASKISSTQRDRMVRDTFLSKESLKSRRRVFGTPTNVGSSDALSGNQQRLDQFIEALQPCFLNVRRKFLMNTAMDGQRDSPNKNCVCSICSMFDEAHPAKRLLVIQFQHEVFLKSFIGRWVCSHNILLPSFEVYSDLNLFLQAKSEGVLRFQDAFFGMVMKHWSKFSTQYNARSGSSQQLLQSVDTSSNCCTFVKSHCSLIHHLNRIDFVTIGTLYTLLVSKVYKATLKITSPTLPKRARCGICEGSLSVFNAPESFRTEVGDSTVLGDEELTRNIRFRLNHPCSQCHIGPSFAENFLTKNIEGAATTVSEIANECNKLLHSLWCKEYSSCECAFPDEFVLCP